MVILLDPLFDLQDCCLETFLAVFVWTLSQQLQSPAAAAFPWLVWHLAPLLFVLSVSPAYSMLLGPELAAGLELWLSLCSPNSQPMLEKALLKAFELVALHFHFSSTQVGRSLGSLFHSRHLPLEAAHGQAILLPLLRCTFCYCFLQSFFAPMENLVQEDNLCHAFTFVFFHTFLWYASLWFSNTGWCAFIT